jgi:hypothetical protein
MNDGCLGEHEHFRPSGRAAWLFLGRSLAQIFPGASCAGRREMCLVNRLSGFPVVEEIWHEFRSCLLT